MLNISEKNFEASIEAALLARGAGTGSVGASIAREVPTPDGGYAPGGYMKRPPEDYDRTRCLIPGDVIDFILATQPKEWKKLKEHHGADVRDRFLARLSSEIGKRGTLDVLRKGIKDSGCAFRLVFFPPSSGLNPELGKLHAANLFSVVRQVKYSEKNEKSLDMGLLLNGLPIFTAELKNPLNGQTVTDAIKQYKFDRDPREPIFAFGRCLAHFAVDPDLVYVTTHLREGKSRFLPFNKGKFGGAGNPPKSPVEGGFATDYLWKEVWARESVLNLLQYFVHEVEEEDEDLEDRIIAEMKKRGRQKNVSTFAFTATPKPKTLELFGMRRPDGKFDAFSLYAMRQAIEENFILDVLENYTTYKSYWRLLKKIADDPKYPKDKANYLLRSFVDLHDHAIRKKIEIMVDHFHGQVAGRIEGKAKAMIVCRSRLHAVRFKLALDAYLKEKKYPYRVLVAFSGTVKDAGIDYTEPGMNGFPEKQTARTFKRSEYRFLVVANKFQTGFDQPLLHTMYVDKKLGGVNAVQTLSRLNRTYPEKKETMVLDFANEAEDIRKAFEPYYEKTILSESTDPNLLYDLENRLLGFHVYSKMDADTFAAIFFDPKATQDKLYAALTPCVDRFKGLPVEERPDFRGELSDYVRLYAFLSQIITFKDPDLEKLYVFAKFLGRYLPGDGPILPVEVQQAIDMESYKIQRVAQGKISLSRGDGVVDPISGHGPHGSSVEEMEALSRIIKELNERFGTDFTEDDKVFIRQLEERLANDTALLASIRGNPPENARLTFDHVVTNRLQDMMDTNFKFYKRVTDDQDFAKYFLDWFFDRFRAGLKNPEQG
jgi:hypothetical protein